jgi:hypothetical protein
MERARATWTDERLDDLSGRIDSGFSRVDQDLRSLRSELTAVRTELGARIDAQGAELGARLDALQRAILQVGGGIVGAILVAIVTLIATHG